MDYIKYMQDELEGAKEYCEVARNSTDIKERQMFKEMALTELSHFDNLYTMLANHYETIKNTIQSL